MREEKKTIRFSSTPGVHCAVRACVRVCVLNSVAGSADRNLAANWVPNSSLVEVTPRRTTRVLRYNILHPTAGNARYTYLCVRIHRGNKVSRERRRMI